MTLQLNSCLKFWWKPDSVSTLLFNFRHTRISSEVSMRLHLPGDSSHTKNILSTCLGWSKRCGEVLRNRCHLERLCYQKNNGCTPEGEGSCSSAMYWCRHSMAVRSKGSKQESPAIADKPARRESLPKLLQFDVPTTLSLTILAYLYAFNCCCVRNPRNPEKFTENSNLWSSRSSKVVDIGVNRKPICDLLLVINSNFSRICYRFRDIHG